MAEISAEIAGVAARYRAALATLGVVAEQVYLFGSYRTGTAREGSDIDLIVVSRDFEPIGYWDRLSILGIAAPRILEPIEATGFSPGEIASGDISSFWKHVLENEALLLA